jgi:hypothetical protein
VYDDRAKPVAESGFDLPPEQQARMKSALLRHQALIQELVAQAVLNQPDARVERISQDDPNNEITFAAAPIRNRLGAATGAVLTETVVEQRQVRGFGAEAYDKYEQLQREKIALLHAL